MRTRAQRRESAPDFLRLNGDGTFRVQELSLPHRPPTFDSDALGDVDGDGAPDLVVSHGSGIVSVVLNDGDGRFSAPRSFELDHPSYATTVAPLDSTNHQADLVMLTGEDFIGFVPGACL
jgi:hypothetical protein